MLLAGVQFYKPSLCRTSADLYFSHCGGTAPLTIRTFGLPHIGHSFFGWSRSQKAIHGLSQLSHRRLVSFILPMLYAAPAQGSATVRTILLILIHIFLAPWTTHCILLARLRLHNLLSLLDVLLVKHTAGHRLNLVHRLRMGEIARKERRGTQGSHIAR